MIGKKKSGFQITSVTSDYDGGSAEGPKESLNGEAELGNPLVNGGHPVEPGPPADRTQPPPPATEGGPPGAGARPEGAGAPRTPARDGGPCTSRFRVVKLCQGLGEPYRRGRWTCLDLYDWDLDSHVLAKVLEGARHVNSLDSHLEAGGLAHKAVSQLRPKAQAPKSQGSPCLPDAPRGKPAASNTLSTLIQAARTLSLDGAPGVEPQPASASGSPPSRASPRSPVGRGVATPKEGGEGGGALGTPEEANSGPGQPLGNKPVGGEPADPSKQLSSNVKQPASSSGEQGAVRKFSEPWSTPVSPAPLTQDGSPSRKSRASEPSIAGGGTLRFASPMQTLAKSMLSVGTQPDGDDDSGSSSSMVAIDNKIEQAMDLVKSHLMYAVREEVELLKEQIKDLVDRNSLLERENALLKSLASPDQLSQLQGQLRSAGSSAGSSGSSNTA